MSLSVVNSDLPNGMCKFPVLSSLYSTFPPLKSLTACMHFPRDWLVMFQGTTWWHSLVAGERATEHSCSRTSQGGNPVVQTKYIRE